MAFGQLSPEVYQAIEIAVKTTGQNAIADLEGQLLAVTRQIDTYRQALAAGAITTNDFIAATDRLIAQQGQLQQSIGAAQNVMKGLPAGFALSGQAALSLSYALDDLQYGFSAIVNNAPHLAQALGLGPGVAGALGALFVVLNQVIKHWPDLVALFSQGAPAKLLDDIKDVEKALKDLTEKEWKTRVDVRDIENAKRQLDELNKAKRGYEGFKGLSEADKRRGEAITEAVVEGGGPEAVTQAVISAAVGPESAEVRAARENQARLAAQVQEARAGGNFQVAHAIEAQRLRDLQSDEGARAIQDQNRREAVVRQLGLAGQGDPRQVRWLRELFEAPGNADKFAAFGVDVDRFAGGMEAAKDENLFADERRKRLETQRKREEAAAERAEVENIQHEQKMKADAERAQTKVGQEQQGRVNEAVRRFGQGMDDAIEQATYDAMKAGATPEAAMRGQRAGAIGKLRGKGVGEDVVGDAADLIIQRATDRATALLQEGGQPRMARQAETAARKAQADLEERAGKVDQAFTNRAAALYAQNMERIAENQGARMQGLPEPFPVPRDRRQQQQFETMGQPYALPPNVLGGQIQQRIATDLGATGQDPGLAPEIRRRGAELAQTRMTEAMARTPMPDPAAMAGMLGERQAGIVARQIQLQGALMQVIQGFLAQANQQDAALVRQATQANGLVRQQGRNQQRRGTLQKTF